MFIKDAATVRQALNGLVCLYKPQGYTWSKVRGVLLGKICDNLNSMNVREPKKFVHIDGDTTKPLEMTVTQNYADHPLMAGPRYIPNELKACSAGKMSENMSGVIVVGLNKNVYQVFELHGCNPLSTYHVTGQFGIGTDTKFETGRVNYTCNFHNLERFRLDKCLAVIQALHKRRLVELTGYHMTSQEAYNIIASGDIRPTMNELPIVYSLKCIDWNLPHFTLEVVCVNENEAFLLDLIMEIGGRMGNMTITNKMRRIRYSFFSIEDALLLKHWDLQNVITNMELCRRRLEKNPNYIKYVKKVEIEDQKIIPNHEETVEDDSYIKEEETLY